jgi:hypothetical protein
MSRPTCRSIVLAAVAAFSTGWTARGLAGEAAGLPTPPHQADAWSPPVTRLPRFLVTATRTLHEQGLADPRGCEYRNIEIDIIKIWDAGGRAANTRTHGWVLPRTPDRKEDFAVCWNGLVYPVAKVGDKADLDADIRALVDSVKSSRAENANSKRSEFSGGFRRGIPGFPDGQAVAVQQPSPIKIYLLLRVGRADLAESFFAATTVWKPDATARDQTHYGISYLSLASDWTWYLFDRAVDAHMRGDDRVALADSRLLVETCQKIEARAAAMGFPKPQRRAGVAEDHPYLGFLHQVAALHDDQERRAREPRRGEVPPRGAEPGPRIAALIANLDQIGQPQKVFPGGVDLRGTPAVRALIDEGDAAVEPLLRVLESDNRLTRSVSSRHRRDPRYRNILEVHEVAYVALMEILRTRNFDAGPHNGFMRAPSQERRTRAALVRAYWEKNRGVPAVERWYGTLRDDAATPPQWQEAASNLIQQAGLSRAPRKPGEAVAQNADAHRDRHDPSISELIARRALDLARPDSEIRQGGSFPLNDACQLAFQLNRWDPKAAQPVLITVTNRCLDEFRGKATAHVPSSRQSLLDNLSHLAGARADSGDLAPLGQVAEIVRQLTEQDVTYPLMPLIDLMSRYPKDPAIASAAEWLFNDPQSPWLAELRRTHFQSIGDPSYDKPGMLELAGFRERLEILLDDTTELGTVRVHETKNIRNLEIIWKDQDPRGRAVTKLDPSAPKPGPETPFRVCDYVAWQFSIHRFAGMPAFELEWPQPRRDEALQARRDALKRHDR